MVFQLIRCTAPDVTTRTGKLLPHLFTLSPLGEAEGGGFFLLHFYTLADIFPLRSMMLCVDRTFLPYLSKAGGRGDGTTCCAAKIVKTGDVIKILVIFARCKDVHACTTITNKCSEIGENKRYQLNRL
jgi:hypothetical protein